jgi:DUF4097 and DUF4098 domain-containing protein YvlB
MKQKWIIASILIVALIAVCAGMIFVTWMGIRGAGEQFSLKRGNFSATADEEWTLETSDGAQLIVDSSAGDIIIIGTTDTDQVHVVAYKTAWGATPGKADANLAGIQIDVSQNEGKITITFEAPSQITMFGSSLKTEVDFNIVVPLDSITDANTDFGDVEISNTANDVTALTSFGDIEVTDIEGGVDVRSESGKITAQNISADEQVLKLESAFGNVILKDATGLSVRAHSNSGSIEFERVTSSHQAELSSEFGDITFRTGEAGSLTAKTNSGEVELRNLSVDGLVFARSKFGDITLDQVLTQSFELDTDSGSVTVEGCTGTIQASSGFGNVEVTQASQANLDLFTESGSITFSGSLGEGPHTLKSKFGDIEFSIPATTALSFDLETGFGSISSDFEFEVTINGGSLDEKHWVGTINGGGAELLISTESGSISLESPDE